MFGYVERYSNSDNNKSWLVGMAGELSEYIGY